MSPFLSNIINFDPFRADAPEWKRFARVLLLVAVVPFTLVALTAEVVAWRTGETLSPDEAAQLQQQTHYRWAPYRDNNSERFKLARAGQEQPEILIVGASRMCQFRHEMFAPYSFYNFSRVSWPLDTYPDVVRHVLARCHPRVMFLGVDFFTFNPRYTKDKELNSLRHIYREHDWRDEFLAWRDAFVAIAKHPWMVMANGHDPDNGEPVIGLHTNLDSGGFRFDGSEIQTHTVMKDYRDPDRDMLKGNLLNRQPLLFGDAMGKNELGYFETIVGLARAQGIQVVAVQMPMYGPLVRYLEKDDRFGILKEFQKRVADGYFDRLGITATFDFLKFPPYTEDPRYFVDAYHPSEPVSAAALFVMLSDHRVKALLPKIDQKALGEKVVGNFSDSQHVYIYNPGN